MKINPIQGVCHRSPSQLLRLLVAPALLASTALAESPGLRRKPTRLPLVTALQNTQAPMVPLPAAEGVDTQVNVVAEISVKPESAAADSIDGPGKQRPAIQIRSLRSEVRQIEDAKDTSLDRTSQTQWLRSSTSSAAAEVARRLIAQATREHEVGASLSAEASAWEAIRWAAEGVDRSAREYGNAPPHDSETSAVHRLNNARQAIREARDFCGALGSIDAEAIKRKATSHATDILDDQPTQGLSATDAADRYLDHARIQLAPVAAHSVEAAQAMDLLAAIYLCRADSKTLPSSTALCLRRAALQGQPGNASLAARLGMHLADVGLMDEARWALQHSMSIESDPETVEALVRVLRRSGQYEDAAVLIASMQHTPLAAASTPNLSRQQESPQIKIPQITELSPSDFAALSRPVMQAQASSSTTKTSLASVRKNSTSSLANQAASAADAADPRIREEQPEKQAGAVRRLIDSLRRIW